MCCQISKIDESTVSAFKKNKINGEVFLSLTDEEIAKDIRCTFGERKSLLFLIASYRNMHVFIFLLPILGLGCQTSLSDSESIIHVTSEWVDSFITRCMALYGGHHKW